jgi:hypothetical protein
LRDIDQLNIEQELRFTTSTTIPAFPGMRSHQQIDGQLLMKRGSSDDMCTTLVHDADIPILDELLLLPGIYIAAVYYQD